MSARWAALLALLVAAPAGAEPRREIVPLVGPEGTPWADGVAEWVALVNRIARGRRVRAVPGGVTGDEVETARQCAEGRLFGWAGSSGALGAIVPELNAIELPYLFEDERDVDAVVQGAVVEQLGRLLRKKGLELIGVTEVGWRSFGGKRPLRRPADFDGLRVRSQENPTHLEMWRLLGARPKQISVLETLSALQAGVVEAFDQSPVYTFATSWHTAIRTYSLSRHMYQLGVLVTCKGALATLDAPTRARMLDAGRGLLPGVTRRVRALTTDVLDQLRQERIDVLELTAQERAALRDRTRPAHEAFRGATSAAGRELLAALEASLRRSRAGR